MLNFKCRDKGVQIMCAIFRLSMIAEFHTCCSPMSLCDVCSEFFLIVCILLKIGLVCGLINRVCLLTVTTDDYG